MQKIISLIVCSMRITLWLENAKSKRLVGVINGRVVHVAAMLCLMQSSANHAINGFIRLVKICQMKNSVLSKSQNLPTRVTRASHMKLVKDHTITTEDCFVSHVFLSLFRLSIHPSVAMHIDNSNVLCI